MHVDGDGVMLSTKFLLLFVVVYVCRLCMRWLSSVSLMKNCTRYASVYLFVIVVIVLVVVVVACVSTISLCYCI